MLKKKLVKTVNAGPPIIVHQLPYYSKVKKSIVFFL